MADDDGWAMHGRHVVGFAPKQGRLNAISREVYVGGAGMRWVSVWRGGVTSGPFVGLDNGEWCFHPQNIPSLEMKSSPAEP